MSYCVVRTVGVVGDARIHCVSLDLFIFAVLFGVLSVLEFGDWHEVRRRIAEASVYFSDGL